MSDRDALLAAIREAPRDDAPRLVYADWLDEHGDPDRAEFIRLQCEIAPLRQATSDLDRWRRAVIDLHPDDPVPADFPPDLHRYAALARRERDLLKARRWEWLEPLAVVEEDYTSHLAVTFRRGFAEEAALSTSAFVESGELVRWACPLLRKLTLYGPRDQVPDLVAVPALGGIAELHLAGWITAHDARALAPSLPLRDVESLTLWVGSREDAEVVRTLASRPWEGGPGRPLDGPFLPALREVVLVQLNGGLRADDPHGRLDRRADGLAGEFNRLLRRPVARVERPWARRFPLYAAFGDGLVAGRLAGRPAIAVADRGTILLQFDPDGRPHGEEEWADADGPVPGFVPGPAFVREFTSELADLSVYLFGSYEDVVEDPDSRTDGDEHETACASLAGYWMTGGNFVVLSGHDYIAGPAGRIHSS